MVQTRTPDLDSQNNSCSSSTTWTHFRTKNKVVMPNWMLYPWFSWWFVRMSLQRGSCLYRSRYFLSKVSPHDASASTVFYYK